MPPADEFVRVRKDRLPRLKKNYPIARLNTLPVELILFENLSRVFCPQGLYAPHVQGVLLAPDVVDMMMVPRGLFAEVVGPELYVVA